MEQGLVCEMEQALNLYSPTGAGVAREWPGDAEMQRRGTAGKARVNQTVASLPVHSTLTSLSNEQVTSKRCLW